jgi:nucleoside-diphosphate-sugar epimerase
VRGDIRDAGAVAAAVEGMDAVCHLAYINGTEFFYTKPDLILEVAVKGMVNVLDACIAAGVRNLILASSSEVYQDPPVIPTDETVPLVVPDVMNPRYSYGGGKIISELLLMNYALKHFDRAIVFRPHNVYGPNMGNEHVIPQFALRMRELFALRAGVVDFPIQGDGTETRSFVYIDDFVDGLLAVIERGDHLGIYHIGTEDEVAIRELAQVMAGCFNRTIRVTAGQVQRGSPRRRCPDTRKLRALGYAPRTPLREGLARTIRWYVGHAEQAR